MGENANIVTAILAGGHARRLEGAVKANLVVAGHPLLSRVLAALTPQSNASVLCVAPRHVTTSWVKATQLPVAVDAVEDAGPLAAVAAAMSWTHAIIPDARAVVTVPVDVPFVPMDLVARLANAVPEEGIAVAESGNKRHYAVALWSMNLKDALETTIAAGTAGALHRWQARHPVVHVPWTTQPYDPFFNINTPADLKAAARIAAIADNLPGRTS